MDELVTKNKLLEVVLNEWDKYEDNSIILTRLINCITNLPDMLENTNTTIIEREKRKNKLEKLEDWRNEEKAKIKESFKGLREKLEK